MKFEIGTHTIICGQAVQKITCAVDVPNMTKTVEHQLFEAKNRASRKIVLKNIVKRENELGIRH